MQCPHCGNVTQGQKGHSYVVSPLLPEEELQVIADYPNSERIIFVLGFFPLHTTQQM
jgi:hypothetical protein